MNWEKDKPHLIWEFECYPNKAVKKKGCNIQPAGAPGKNFKHIFLFFMLFFRAIK